MADFAAFACRALNGRSAVELVQRKVPLHSINRRCRIKTCIYTNGVPDFSQLGIARVNITNPLGRGPGINGNADLKAASRALWREIEAGRVSRSLFTREQLDDLADGIANPSGLTWHHNGTQLNPNGTGPMLLLDTSAHGVFRHVGWASKINR